MGDFAAKDPPSPKALRRAGAKAAEGGKDHGKKIFDFWFIRALDPRTVLFLFWQRISQSDVEKIRAKFGDIWCRKMRMLVTDSIGNFLKRSNVAGFGVPDISNLLSISIFHAESVRRGVGQRLSYRKSTE